MRYSINDILAMADYTKIIDYSLSHKAKVKRVKKARKGRK